MASSISCDRSYQQTCSRSIRLSWRPRVPGAVHAIGLAMSATSAVPAAAGATAGADTVHSSARYLATLCRHALAAEQSAAPALAVAHADACPSFSCRSAYTSIVPCNGITHILKSLGARRTAGLVVGGRVVVVAVVVRHGGCRLEGVSGGWRGRLPVLRAVDGVGCWGWHGSRRWRVWWW